ncbi:MAG: TIGR04086 family membrane protein [Tissierellaceae bacterium]
MKNGSKNKSRLNCLLKGILLAFVITFISIFIISLLLRFTNLREGKLPILNNIIMMVSIVISSIYLAMQVKEKGWLNGAFLGLGYYLVIVLLSFVAIKSISLDVITGAKLMVATLTGSIGGMIGINLT